jgi:hypothetical protein
MKSEEVTLSAHRDSIWRFLLAAILTPVLSWIAGSAMPSSPMWLSFVGELAAMLLAVFVASLVGRARIGWAAATGLGLTFGLAAVIILLFGIRGVNACGGHGPATIDCPDPPVTSALLILLQVGLAIAAAFWVGVRFYQTRPRRDSHTTPDRPDVTPATHHT